MRGVRRDSNRNQPSNVLIKKMKSRSTAPIRVGVLFSETGVTSVIELSEKQGTLLAVQEINEAG